MSFIKPAVTALLALLASELPGMHVRRPDDGAQPRPVAASTPRFHHVHLVPGDPDRFADYYFRLFVPGRVERGEFWGHPGVRDARATLLFSARSSPRRGGSSVVWQMGWGAVSLDHSYRQHYAREVDWAPPYTSLSDELHLHLRTRNATAAAEWYRDVLGAAIDISRHAASPDEGVTRALVRVDGLTLALHTTAEPIMSSRDAGDVDHIAFTVGTIAGFPQSPALQPPGAPYTLRAKRSALLTGPDGMLIELIEEQW